MCVHQVLRESWQYGHKTYKCLNLHSLPTHLTQHSLISETAKNPKGKQISEGARDYPKCDMGIKYHLLKQVAGPMESLCSIRMKLL
jgi:hypothetical protein